MIGAERRLIALLAATRVPDEAGGAGVSYAPSEDVWAAIERLASTQDFAGDRSVRLKRIAATIRMRNDIEPGARIRVDGEDYEIVSIEDGDDSRRRIVLIAEEVRA